MKRSAFFISIIFLSFSLNSCLDYVERCGMDHEYREYELWALNTNNFKLSNVYLLNSYSGYDSHYRIYGISPDDRYLYYTDNYISSNKRLFGLNLESLDTNQIHINSNNGDYVLSPSGNFFAYQKKSTVWVSNIEEISERAIRGIRGSHYFTSPKWYLNDNKLLINVTGITSINGIWMVNLIDTTFTKITDLLPNHYDISDDGSKIAVQDKESSETSLIKFKPIFSNNFITLHEGSRPKFVNNGNDILFQYSGGVYISDLSGNAIRIFSKTGDGEHSIMLSPDKGLIAYYNQVDLNIYETQSHELLYALNKNEFMPEIKNWTSIDVDLTNLIFSPDNETLYFIVEKRFFSDGC